MFTQGLKDDLPVDFQIPDEGELAQRFQADMSFFGRVFQKGAACKPRYAVNDHGTGAAFAFKAAAFPVNGRCCSAGFTLAQGDLFIYICQEVGHRYGFVAVIVKYFFIYWGGGRFTALYTDSDHVFSSRQERWTAPS